MKKCCKLRMLSKMEVLIVYFHELTKCSEWTEEKSKSNQYLVWPPFAFKTASILLGTLAQSFWRKSAGRLFQTSWRTNHRSSVDVGFLKSFCLFMLSQTDLMTNQSDFTKEQKRMSSRRSKQKRNAYKVLPLLYNIILQKTNIL